ncbi:hypothetical protein NDU88_003400 [Pleurodeles waltl]|uniref:Uncharacterized protein n=1 Tax=Pleurodeles waltl TaxID=8319 RepID=A0AAV7VF98_PLEWA|nr:hypothetical protein NDU88_003400 [Pleurodeles waltl]
MVRPRATPIRPDAFGSRHVRHPSRAPRAPSSGVPGKFRGPGGGARTNASAHATILATPPLMELSGPRNYHKHWKKNLLKCELIICKICHHDLNAYYPP